MNPDVPDGRHRVYMLTLALVTGILFLEDIFAQHLVHKTVLSIIAWLVFATCLGPLAPCWRPPSRSTGPWAACVLMLTISQQIRAGTGAAPLAGHAN
jgi:ABC-type uncharacterized transport system permease subunit